MGLRGNCGRWVGADSCRVRGRVLCGGVRVPCGVADGGRLGEEVV